MRKILMFTDVSIDGFFEAPGHDLSGFKHDNEAFAMDSGGEVDTILLGHNTYKMMKIWSNPQMVKNAPGVGAFMNETLKVVASHHEFDPGWKNVRVISGDDVVDQVRRLKEEPGQNIIIFGSNTLCVSLAQAGLIDEFQIQVNPVLFGKGTTLFDGLPGKMDLKLKDVHRLKSGSVLLIYEPG